MRATETAAPLRADPGEIVARLAAEPRPAGGLAEARARASCAAFLAERGFSVRELPFEYSAFPGRWATPAGGAASIALLLGAGHLGYRGDAGWALALLVVGGGAVAAAAAGLASAGVLRFPALRRTGVNLAAERGETGDGDARVWLVAHLDSKSQPVPIGARAAGIVGSVLAWAAALGLLGAQLAGMAVGAWWPALSAIGVAAGLPVLLSVVGARSPGALDNASGVATVLCAAAAVPASVPLGVLLTSAEELGLAGARAWAEGARAGTAINVDGVDDDGVLTAMYTGAAPAALLAALARAAAADGTALRTRRLVPGILVDAVALAARGWRTATLSRGTLRTLARIHRPADRADRVRGRGVGEAARVAAAAVMDVHRNQGG